MKIPYPTTLCGNYWSISFFFYVLLQNFCQDVLFWDPRDQVLSTQGFCCFGHLRLGGGTNRHWKAKGGFFPWRWHRFKKWFDSIGCHRYHREFTNQHGEIRRWKWEISEIASGCFTSGKHMSPWDPAIYSSILVLAINGNAWWPECLETPSFGESTWRGLSWHIMAAAQRFQPNVVQNWTLSLFIGWNKII